MQVGDYMQALAAGISAGGIAGRSPHSWTANPLSFFVFGLF